MVSGMRKKDQRERDFNEAQNRARSFTVGTAFGGVTEISMRRADSVYTYALLQPVEVIELIHQLAANVGCHLQLTPRRDFASWRSWSTPEPEHGMLGTGWPPYPEYNIASAKSATTLPLPEAQPGMPSTLKGDEYGETLAVEAPKQRRKSKRAPASS